jgi:predicted Zn-dependent peptidase
MEEIAQGKARGGDEDDPFSEMVFAGTPLARSILGSVESIAGLERDSVLAFYHRWYAPNNMMLFVTGDFTADTMSLWLNDKLKEFRPHEVPARRRIDQPDFKSLRDLGIVSRYLKSDKLQVEVGYAAPRPGDGDFSGFILLKSALQSRLDKNLPAGCSADMQIVNDPDFSVLHVVLNSPSEASSGEELLANFDRTLTGILQKPPDKQEIQRLARQYRAERIFDSERLHHFGIVNAEYWALVPWDDFDSWPQRMALLTPEALRNLTQNWLVGADRFVSSQEPMQDVNGDKAADTDTTIVERFPGDDGSVVLTLTDPTARVFALHILFKNRWLFDREYGVGSVDLLHRMLNEATKGDGKPVAQKLDELAARIKLVDDPYLPFDDYYTTPEYSFLRLETLPEDWRAGVDLVVDLLSRSDLNQEALEAAKSQAMTANRGDENNPVKSGRRALRQKLFPDTELAAVVYGNVEGLKLDSLKELSTRYLQPGNMIVSVSSPVDGKTVAESIREVFKKIGGQDAHPTIVEIGGQDAHPTNLDVGGQDAHPTGENMDRQNAHPTGEAPALTESWRDTINLGKAQGALVSGRIIGSIDADDLPALTLVNGYFNDRMGEYLRETLGLAYSLGSSMETYPAESDQIWIYWEIYISTRQENLTRAEDGINELLEELKIHKFADDEVEKLRNALIGKLLMRDMSRISQAYGMGVGEFRWGDPGRRDKLVNKLKQVTADEMARVVLKYLSEPKAATMIID